MVNKRSANTGILIFIIVFCVYIIHQKIQVSPMSAKAEALSSQMPYKKISDPTLNFKIKLNNESISIPKSKLKTNISPKEFELICKFKMTKSNVPQAGPIQMVGRQMELDLSMTNINLMWIKSPDCPQDLYSIVHFSDDGTIHKEIDCRTTDLTEIMKFSGDQGNILDHKSDKDHLNIAINGPGYFILKCIDNKILLTRDGRFTFNSQDQIINDDGCVLLDQNNQYYQKSEIQPDGCNSHKQCIATVDPGFDEVIGLKYKNSYSFEADDIPDLEKSITKLGPDLMRPNLLFNTIEDLFYKNRNATSVYWGNYPTIDLNDIDCDH